MQEHDAVFQWLLFGHLLGVAVLAAGVGSYVAGLHRFRVAASVEQLRAAAPVVRLGEMLTLVGFVLVIGTGIGLGLDVDAFGNAWLTTSLVLLAVIAAAGRIAGTRLIRLFAALQAGDGAAAEPESLLRLASSRAIHLSAEITVLAMAEIIYLMTMQPGDLGIAVSLLIAVLITAAVTWAAERGGGPGGGQGRQQRPAGEVPSKR